MIKEGCLCPTVDFKGIIENFGYQYERWVCPACGRERLIPYTGPPIEEKRPLYRNLVIDWLKRDNNWLLFSIPIILGALALAVRP
jgi:hypothetical protein